MSVVTYFDGTGNRKLDMIDYNLPMHGKERLNIYSDLTAGKVVKSIPGMDFCWEFDLPDKSTLKQWVDKILNPEGGITTYLGTKNVLWNKTVYHAFRVTVQFGDIKRSMFLYFNTVTLQLEWV